MPLRHAASLLALATALTAAPALAAPKTDPAKLVASPAFKKAVAQLDADFDRTVADIVTLTEIPARRSRKRRAPRPISRC
jgi:tripeptide aminopeptidase